MTLFVGRISIGISELEPTVCTRPSAVPSGLVVPS